LDKGLYIAVFYLPQDRNIQVGRAFKEHFQSGYYFYVGSALRNLSARLERHSRKKKPLRWHIDYLSVKAEMLGAIVISDSRWSECEIAMELAGMYEMAVPGFGSSDCRCGGHLFYARELP
jgi:sugar fermentation stimulation protein A